MTIKLQEQDHQTLCNIFNSSAALDAEAALTFMHDPRTRPYVKSIQQILKIREDIDSRRVVQEATHELLDVARRSTNLTEKRLAATAVLQIVARSWARNRPIRKDHRATPGRTIAPLGMPQISVPNAFDDTPAHVPSPSTSQPREAERHESPQSDPPPQTTPPPSSPAMPSGPASSPAPEQADPQIEAQELPEADASYPFPVTEKQRQIRALIDRAGALPKPLHDTS